MRYSANLLLVIIKIQILVNIHIYIYIMVDVIALTEILLSKWYKLPCFVFVLFYVCAVYVSFFCPCLLHN
jgi:hypothetical protein